MNKTFILLIISVFTNFLFSQCNENEIKVDIVITPDQFPTEISWNISANGNIVQSGTSEGGSFCLNDQFCYKFEIFDQYGDGICCNYGEGSYKIYVDDALIAEGGEYSTSDVRTFNCPAGSSCNNPLTINEGNHVTNGANSWYLFTAPQTGMYELTTCNQTTCDTKLWIYETCNAMVYNYDNMGTLFYDDNEGGCGLQAKITAYFQQGISYLIKVGFATPTTICGTQNIPFSLNYTGQISGCTDPTACNYNPLAGISDGSCVYFPNPLCPGGPDLMILEDVVRNSLEVRQQDATNCMVEEGCLSGYGNRTIIAFDTHIKNIGDVDYYIGTPEINPTNFSFENCHGHTHYEGYADYILYKQNGGSIPIGHKNGFCVMDLECSDGGTAQYGCGNMGISKQCGDIYSRELDCQWIDITDVEPGEYILAVKVNWNHAPDALGRHETSYENNWAQVCINITIDNFGNKGFEILNDCEPYVDCAGIEFGNSTVDCNGECGGSAVFGDLDNNSSVQNLDANLYVQGRLNNTLSTTTCNDLSGDGLISVWDAALASNCALNSGSSACNFPNSTFNTTQTVQFGFIEVNSNEKYVDVFIKNPQNKILAYEFDVVGINITEVENMIDPLYYPITPQFNSSSGKIIGISLVDSLVIKNSIPTKLARIHYSELTNDIICISNVTHIINNDHEPVIVNLVENCLSLASVEEIGLPSFSLHPNPANSEINLTLNSKFNEKIKVSIIDGLGREIASKELKNLETNLKFDLDKISNGYYQLVLSSKSTKKTQPFIVKHK